MIYLKNAPKKYVGKSKYFIWFACLSYKNADAMTINAPTAIINDHQGLAD